MTDQSTHQLIEKRFFNRDLSWLEFNSRVLAQAEDDRVPLLERAKFCAIFASNTDEFFMKRVGLIKRRLANPATRDHVTPDGLTLDALLTRSRDVIMAQTERLTNVWENDLKPSLAEAGIRIMRYNDVSKAARASLDAWYEANVFPVLTPLAVDPSHRFPFISNLSENFGLILTKKGDESQQTFARVKIPGVVSRFIPVPQDPEDGGEPADANTFTFVALDDLIAHNLGRLFPGMTIREVVAFRVTRSAAMTEDDDEIDDMLQHVENELRRRRFAETVRVETPPDAPERVIKFITAQLGLTDNDVYRRSGPLEFADLFELIGLPRPDLKHEYWGPIVPPPLRDLPPLEDADTPAAQFVGKDPDAVEDTIFGRIRRGDILLHHPYDSFKHSVERFIAEAADDPDVLAIKQTIYRTSPDSPFVRSLIRAADNGKNVAALVELRARFDEERNVSFARQLEHAGVHVAYGVLGLKTHCKCSLVVRREREFVPAPTPDNPNATAEREVLRTYAHLGTGNYHPKTAQLYTDLGLLTANESVTSDVVKMFNALTGHAAEQHYQRLLVAPVHMRRQFSELIDREIDHARAGRPARIVAKMNQLEDRKVTSRLYEASAAGVQIQLFIRGFCCLVPGVEGLSENIRVTSVIGRLLEHARIFHFGNGKPDPVDGDFYIGSADWMYRNLNDRVEAATPILDPVAKQRIWGVLDIMSRDGRNAWDLGPDGIYTRRTPDESAEEWAPERVGTFRAMMAETIGTPDQAGVV